MISKTKLKNFKEKFEIVSSFVEHDGYFLVLHRQSHKPQGNTWGVPAGKVHKNDIDLKQALSREILEETGLIFDSNNLNYFESYFVRYDDYDFIYHIFNIKLDMKPNIVLSPDEHKDYKWIKPEDAFKLDLIQDEDFCIKNYYKIL